MLKFRVGVSYYNKDYLRAEMAQEYAKELGKDIVLGSEVIKDNKVFQENITWYKKLKKALEEDRIVPFYQPIVDRDKKVVKYEALVRMIDEDEKVISPFFFLDIAKMTRNYFEITKRMIKKSFEKFNNKDIGVSINLDLHDLESNEIRNYIMEHLNKCNVKATFEVVESEDIRNSKEITQYLKTFQKNGAEIYIDDFGSGYANFDYLLKLSPNGVKIDGSLVKDITENKKNETMIRAIVSFSHDIGLKVVAEFVEDEKIFKKLKELGVDYFQGYYFGKPQKDIKV
jgi:EAL domain-containing protein (putative c-di-GMP-specific phosphodiesterase class I)